MDKEYVILTRTHRRRRRHTHTHTHTHTDVLHSHKREWDCAICNSMDGLRGYYAKWNNSDWERQMPYGFTNMWNLKNKTNEQTKGRIRLINKENTLMVARRNGDEGMGKVGEREWEIQPSYYRMHKSWEYKAQPREYNQWYCNSVLWWQIIGTLVVSIT